MKQLSITSLAAIFFSLSSFPAFAYIDPGTGSIVVQAIIAAVVSASFTIKVYWSRIRSYLSKKSGSSAHASEDESNRDERNKPKD